MFDLHRVLMVNINENITNGDIKNLIFLLSRTVPREKIDKVKVSYTFDVEMAISGMKEVSAKTLPRLPGHICSA